MHWIYGSNVMEIPFCTIWFVDVCKDRNEMITFVEPEKMISDKRRPTHDNISTIFSFSDDWIYFFDVNTNPGSVCDPGQEDKIDADQSK
jgi:hypothetical protein